MSGNATFLAQQNIGNGYLQQANMAAYTGGLKVNGYLMQAQGARASSNAVGAAADFNFGIDAINLERRLDANYREAQLTASQQISQNAASNLGSTGKSFLTIRNETVDYYAKQALNTRLDYENNRRAKLYETQVQQMNLENQARGYEYQANSQQALTNISVGAYQRQANAAFSVGKASLLNSWR